jgi:type I restriction enzyme, R subunit
MTPSPSEQYSEFLTRKRRIDPRLDARGWKLARSSGSPRACCRTEEEPTDNGPADYALWLDNAIAAIVEAKKLPVGPQNVLVQAERYARGIRTGPYNFDGLRAPFLYSSNGEIVWFHDVRHPNSRSRRVADFHTPNALRELLARDHDGAVADLLDRPNDHPKLRPYQRDANAAVERAIADRKRHMLVAMATGTGKTFTMVNQVYRLMKSTVARRVLFLVDRRALAAQAVRAFASFEAEPGLKFDQAYEVYSSKFQREDFDESEKFDPKLLPAAYLTDPKPGHAFVYVCTIQRMAINLFGREAVFRDERGAETDEDASRLDIPIHAFDVVIADECHRGYTAAEQSVWRNTLDHFDSVKIGLTATPAAHTTSYFQHLVYRYDYGQAVRDGFLVDYDVVNVHSDIRVNGLFLNEGETVERVDPESGATQLDLLEDERRFETTDIETKVTATESNRLIVEEIKKHALEHEARTGRFPKTLIFAANDLPHTSHADQLVTLCRDAFGKGDAFVQKITGSRDVDRPLQRIREFRNRPNPGIAVTVDLLSTGVDIPDLEFIVFLRPVKSRILFEQMLGRGTRKGEHFPDKSHFTVFDCFDGSLLAYFKQATGITAEPPSPSSRTVIEIIEDIWNNRDRAYNTSCLVRRLHRIDKSMAAEARADFAAFVPGGDLAAFARELPETLESRFVEVMRLLRDAAFQGLLEHYRRAERVFYVAREAQDSVRSLRMVREAGQEYRPEEYLDMFARFVRENPEKIDAFRVLMSRPRDWSPGALAELREKLGRRFRIENLQLAHEVRYQRALVDIISMVKHAADEQQPLLTAAERVDRVFRKLEGQSFTAEQQQWLDRIRAHMIENLSVDREDFDVVPVFARVGGWSAAQRAFGSQLETLIHDLNEAIAA